MRPRRAQGRPAGRNGRRYWVVLYITGGLLGSGWWLSTTVYDGPVFSKVPTTVHVPQFVVVACVVTAASWGLLLVLGEAMLFALAVIRATDREQYDLYRNLMILWAYVLTLGIPRHFRRLPAQFAGSPDDDCVRAVPPARARERSDGRPDQQAARGRHSGTGGAPRVPRPASGTLRESAPTAGGAPRRQRPGSGGVARERRPGSGGVARERRSDSGGVARERRSGGADGGAPVLGDVELRAALELLLRYAVRYIDQDPDTAEQPGELCEPDEPRERSEPGEQDVVIVDAAVPGVTPGLDTALTD